MAGVTLVPGAIERMQLFNRRLYGEWPGFSVNPDVDYGVFPDALVAQGLRHSPRDNVSRGWPCWFRDTANLLHEYAVGDGENEVRDEELEAYHWALRLARTLAEPVDYDRARDLYVSGALRLLANFEPHGIALRLAHLLETRLEGGGHAFAIASAMLDGFSRYGEVFRAYRNTSDWDLKMQLYPVAETGGALCCLLGDVLSSAVFWAARNQPSMFLWNQAEGSLRRWTAVEHRLNLDESYYVAGPYILKMRQILLDALRGARVDGPAVALADNPLNWPGCQGGYCEVCFERYWLELRDDMTPRERTLIWRRRSELGMEISAFEA